MNDKILELASFVLDFGKVDRKTCHQDGVLPESDTDHTVMLGIISISIASRLYPDLDLGKIAQFSLVHDLVEVYSGDTPTLMNVSEQFFKDKKDREDLALEKIGTNFNSEFPWIYEKIKEYERLDTKEARFIKILDKILPKLTVLLNGARSLELEKYGSVVTRSEVENTFNMQREKLKKLSTDMPELMELWEYFVSRELDLIK